MLGHEIAHNVAHHTAENYSRLSLGLPLAYLASFIYDVSGSLTFMIVDYAYNKPGSRTQEVSLHIAALQLNRERADKYDSPKRTLLDSVCRAPT